VVSGLLDRRQFLAISGAELTAIPAIFRTSRSNTTAVEPVPDNGNPLIEQIEQSIPHLQRLDDASGGGGHISYVGAQFRAVAMLLRDHTVTGRLETRLLRALAEIGQLAGWMAFDAGKQGLAQRYFLTALRAARECGDDAMAAHVIADLAFQSASLERAEDAISLGESAVHIARRVTPAVRSSVHTRLAYGYAIAGDIRQFDGTYKGAVEILECGGTSQDPPWMYYLTPGHLDAQAGYALVHAGILAQARDKSAASKLVRRGEKLLRTGAYQVPADDSSQRRAMFEGAWLANAAAARGNLEQACKLGDTALNRSRAVRSVRSMDVLRRLAERLRRSTRNEYVRDFLPKLETALARQPMSTP
jgi:hypothetical protein